MENQLITINSSQSNQRLDRFLRKQFLKFPLSHIYKLVRAGEIKVNGKKVKGEYFLQIGDKIWIKKAKFQIEKKKNRYEFYKNLQELQSKI